MRPSLLLIFFSRYEYRPAVAAAGVASSYLLFLPFLFTQTALVEKDLVLYCDLLEVVPPSLPLSARKVQAEFLFLGSGGPPSFLGLSMTPIRVMGFFPTEAFS